VRSAFILAQKLRQQASTVSMRKKQKNKLTLMHIWVDKNNRMIHFESGGGEPIYQEVR
jgi:hypothetical protein